jgi:hypothetical protein
LFDKKINLYIEAARNCRLSRERTRKQAEEAKDMQMEKGMADLRREVKVLEQRMNEGDMRCQQVLTEKLQIEIDLRDAVEHGEDLLTQIMTLQEDLKDVMQKRSEIVLILQQTMKQQVSLRESNDSLRERLKEDEAKMMEMKNDADAARIEKNALINALKQDMSLLSKDNQTLLDKIEELQGMSNDLDSEKSSLEEQLAALVEEHSRCQEDMAHKQVELDEKIKSSEAQDTLIEDMQLQSEKLLELYKKMAEQSLDKAKAIAAEKDAAIAELEKQVQEAHETPPQIELYKQMAEQALAKAKSISSEKDDVIAALEGKIRKIRASAQTHDKGNEKDKNHKAKAKAKVEPFVINIEREDGSTMTFVTLKPDANILNVKESINAREGLSIDKQQLVSERVVLQDQQTLKELSIKSNSMMQLRVLKNDDADGKLNEIAQGKSTALADIGIGLLSNISDIGLFPIEKIAALPIESPDTLGLADIAMSSRALRAFLADHHAYLFLLAKRDNKLFVTFEKTFLWGLFHYYASAGDPTRATHIGLNKFRKFCKDAKFCSSGTVRKRSKANLISTASVDLIFTRMMRVGKGSSTKSSSRRTSSSRGGYGNLNHDRQLEFDEFFTAVDEMSATVYPKAKCALHALLKFHLMPLAEKLGKETLRRLKRQGQDPEAISKLAHPHVRQIFKQNKSALHAIFVFYASMNMSIMMQSDKKNIMSSEDSRRHLMDFGSLLSFCKDYDLVPGLLDMAQLQTVFHTVNVVGNEHDDVVDFLDYDEFRELLGRIALMTAKDKIVVTQRKRRGSIGSEGEENNATSSNAVSERVNGLFEWLESSNGHVAMSRRGRGGVSVHRHFTTVDNAGNSSGKAASSND